MIYVYEIVIFRLNSYMYVLLFTGSVVEGLESMTSNPVISLAWVGSLGDALVV
jgi:hypothetical protein